jgi:hypothetical protein
MIEIQGSALLNKIWAKLKPHACIDKLICNDLG